MLLTHRVEEGPRLLISSFAVWRICSKRKQVGHLCAPGVSVKPPSHSTALNALAAVFAWPVCTHYDRLLETCQCSCAHRMQMCLACVEP